MNEITLHFAHANGFPAGSYRKTLDRLQNDYRVIAIDRIGHNPDYPVNDNWSNLADELIDYIRHYTDGPVIGVGHSIGSLITFMAASKTPGLFKQLIMLDPPLLEGAGALLFLAAKKLGIMKRTKLVSQAKKRRIQWTGKDEAMDYFKAKHPFNRFDPVCMQDYVQYGTVPTEGGVKLAFDRDIESDIYRTTPHNIGSYKQALPIPATVVLGRDTYKQSPYMLKRFTRRHGFGYQRLTFGSHLFPLEYPKQTATLIDELIRQNTDE